MEIKDPYSTSSVCSDLATIDKINHRLLTLKKRQLKRRNLLLQHFLLSDSVDVVSDDEANELSCCVRSDKLRRILGPNHGLGKTFDEVTFRKRLILPSISKLRSPVLSRKLRLLIQSLLVKISNVNSGHVVSIGSRNINSIDAISASLSNTLSKSYQFSVNNSKTLVSTDVATGVGSSTEKKNSDDFITTIYTGSSTFLKGTQSANPHNDYSQHFVDTGDRPQNFIRDTGLRNRFEEYPKLRELIRLKDELIQSRATPPMYLRTDLKTFELTDLQSKFDVVLIEPPLEEYHRMNGAVFDQHWTWEEIERLEIEKIVSPRSFVWIWCGSGEGLDAARKCLRKWGFRRCEDICWIKTNTGRPGHETLEPGAVFQRTKEHCLMGIHGTVRRSTDGDFIHANIDIDLIIEDAPKYGGYAAKDKPTEIFHIIEHFCLGRRRLHLFGRDSTLRPGWLTVGSELSASNFDPRLYASNFTKEPTGLLLGSTEDIERLRPKSPPPRHPNPTSTSGTTLVQASTISATGVGSGSNLVVCNSGSATGSTGGASQLNMLSSSHNSRQPGRFSAVSKLHSLQPSLLGLPTEGLNSQDSNLNRGICSDLRSELPRTLQNLQSATTRNLAALQAAAAAVSVHQSIIRPAGVFAPGSAQWSSLANFPFGLITTPSSVSSGSSRSLPLQGNPNWLQSQLPVSPLISTLLAAGKLNPAVIAALTSAAAGGTSVGSLDVSSLPNASSGGRVGSGNTNNSQPSNSRHHTLWR